MNTIKKIYLLSLILGLLCLLPASAQIQVSPGSTHNYETDLLSGATYHWSTDAAGVDLTGFTGNTADITWPVAPNTYNLSVYPILNGCSGDEIFISVLVVGTNIQWNTNGLPECPNSTVYSATPLTLTASFTGIPGDWSFTYSVDGGAAVAATSADPTYTLLATDYDNNTGAVVTHTVRILSVTGSDANIVDYSAETETDATAANRLFTLTVSPKPGALNTITQN